VVDGELSVLLLLVKEEHGVGLAGLDVLYPITGTSGTNDTRISQMHMYAQVRE
jgi:hypothetical protein